MSREGDIFKQWIRDVLREASFALHENIVKRTPIDTGRAKTSWNLNENEADPDVTPLLKDKIGPGGIIERAAKGASPLETDQADLVAIGQRQKISSQASLIVISNNLDYIERLENGSSRQAPQGMFAVSVTQGEVELAFSEAAGRLPI